MDRIEAGTRWLSAPSDEERSQLWEAVYPQLRQVAARLMRMERAGHTLRPTALVHEAYVRMAVQNRAEWENRAQLLAVTARVMRRVLVDHARGKRRLKRGGEAQEPTVDADHALAPDSDPLELLAVDRALQSLAERAPRQAQVVEMRVFGGMTMREIAHLLGVTRRTVTSDWNAARSALCSELGVRSATGLHPALEDGALAELADSLLDERG